MSAVHWAVPIGRRTLFLSSAALFLAGCARGAAPSAATPTPAAPPEFDAWSQEAQGILSDVLNTLRTFDDFQAYRVGTDNGSSMHLPSELAWDAPTGAAWDEATHVTRGLHGRADQLFTAATTARISPELWRTRRALADSTHTLLDLSDALSAYRERVNTLAPGDASAALGLLNTAWKQWDTAAARWGVTRTETISCGNA